MADTHPLFDSTLLPDTIQDPVREALADKQYHTASILITDYLADNNSHTPATLICLALCIVEDTRHGPFEQIMPRSTQALDLLRKARAQGAPAAMIRTDRARIKRIQKREQELQELEAAPPQTLDVAVLNRVKTRAYALDDRRRKPDWLTAARLWRVLYQHTVTTPDPENQGSAFYVFVRAGLAFAKGGRFDLAQPYLKTIVNLEQPVVGREAWMVQYAYYEMLRHTASQNNPTAFEALWSRAVTHTGFFPFAYPVQEEFLAQALAFQLPEICQYLIEVIDQRQPKRKLSEEAKNTLAQARAYVEGTK